MLRFRVSGVLFLSACVSRAQGFLLIFLSGYATIASLRRRTSLSQERMSQIINHAIYGRFDLVREKVMCRFKSTRHLQRFASVHDQVANRFMHCRNYTDAKQKRALRNQTFEAWESVTCSPTAERLAN